jgi:hypothetical protein
MGDISTKEAAGKLGIGGRWVRELALQYGVGVFRTYGGSSGGVHGYYVFSDLDMETLRERSFLKFTKK